MKTFEVFTKLWKFQQENRTILENVLGFPRHEVGEIASKIGQLYYHYYLHTSDAKYLIEALEFYSAIMKRSYFKVEALKSSAICLKYLRYLTRYFVVALLVNDDVLTESIIQTLKYAVDSLSEESSPKKSDWNMVLSEAIIFAETKNFLSVVDDNSSLLYFCFRQKLEKAAELKNSLYKLQNVVIIGASENQVKFSELTIDMYHMILLTEFEPNSNKDETTASFQNPTKHLLYKPTFGEIYSFVSAAFKDLKTATSVLLLYISGGAGGRKENPLSSECTYRKGVATAAESLHDETKGNLTISTSQDCLYPDDIVPFTRKPLFMIVDSENSCCYNAIPNVFHQPFICLMSPSHIAGNRYGGLFTLFLVNSLHGICRLCNVSKLTELAYKNATSVLEKVEEQVLQLLLKEAIDDDLPFRKLLQDIFLRNIMSKYLVCWMVFRLHKSTESEILPTCSPDIPKPVLENRVLYRSLLDGLTVLGVRHLFYELTDLQSI